MNQLPLEKRTKIIEMLVEGMSIRAVSRITGASKNTIAKLLVEVGTACQCYHDQVVVGLDTKRVQCDEIWSFVYSKEKNVPDGIEGEAGDVWTWVGIDADSKLVASWFVGERGQESAQAFMYDLAGRFLNRVQLTTGGLGRYYEAVMQAFETGVDCARLIKSYGNEDGTSEKGDSQAECIGITKKNISGNLDAKNNSISKVERQNLTMRMHMRRFARSTNASNKKIEFHCHAIALHLVYYNFVKIHNALRVTPAQQAGITNYLWEVSDILKLTNKYSN